MHHVAALAAEQAGDKHDAQAYLDKASASFEQAVQASSAVKAGLYTEYGNFLLATGQPTQAYPYLTTAIASNDRGNELYYDVLAQATVAPILQEKIAQDKEIQFRGIDNACYLMIHHYEDFRQAGIQMAQTREAYLAAYQASLDQRKGQPGKEQADRIASYLLESLQREVENQPAVAVAFAIANNSIHLIYKLREDYNVASS